MAQPFFIDIDTAASPDTKSRLAPRDAKPKIGDVIYWRNKDSKVHWPVQKSLVGDSTNMQGWWLTEGIPANSTSLESVSSGVAWTNPVEYVDFYDQDDPELTGTLQVTS